LLAAQFQSLTERVQTAYGGIWRYLLFLGRKTKV
jgi:hypothetical protein